MEIDVNILSLYVANNTYVANHKYCILFIFIFYLFNLFFVIYRSSITFETKTDFLHLLIVYFRKSEIYFNFSWLLKNIVKNI